MPYNPYSYMNFGQPVTTPVQPVTQPQPQPMIWVSGEVGAKSYLVSPGTTVVLWDNESQTIYLKSADATGMPSMRVLDYTIRDAVQPQTQVGSPTYATQADLKSIENRLKILEQKAGAVNEPVVSAAQQTV